MPSLVEIAQMVLQNCFIDFLNVLLLRDYLPLEKVVILHLNKEAVSIRPFYSPLIFKEKNLKEKHDQLLITDI